MKKLISPTVVLNSIWFIVRVAIHLNDQPLRWAVEVDDVGADAVLPTELQSELVTS